MTHGTASPADNISPQPAPRARRRARLAAPRARAWTTIRQGYQTNMWGMPTYYLLRSGALEKRGIKFEEFAVPSGNLTMQQMVARQVDLGTYAGPSFILGHDKGGLVAIAVIEHVGRTTRIMARKDLEHHQGRAAQGPQDRQPDRLLGRQHLRRPDRAGGRPQEGRLPGSAHGREQHGGRHGRQDGRRHGQRRALQRHRRGRRARHHHHGLLGRRQDAGVHGGDAGVRRRRARTPSSPISRPGSTWRATSRRTPTRWPTPSTASTRRRATPCRRTPSARRWPPSTSIPASRPTSKPYMQEQAEVLLKEKKIAAIPDWSKALRPDFMEKARASA